MAGNQRRKTMARKKIKKKEKLEKVEEKKSKKGFFAKLKGLFGL